ncbi:hypothetical protein BH10ACT2_BH10ACT2_19900 [soil metagenome]
MNVDNILWGPASVDRYIDHAHADGPQAVHYTALPGGGALNMAYHWSELGLPFHFLSRIGDDLPDLFNAFFRRHGIECSPSLVAHGPSASIDIRFGADRQPWMDNFVEGVWTGFHLTDAEETLIRSARRLHMVLVDPVADELDRLGDAGALAHLDASGDFLDFRHFDVERFEGTMRWLNTAFIGWPGAIDDPIIAGVRDVVRRAKRLAVITMGSRGVEIVDARDEAAADRVISVTAVDVQGTTVGCGDAFIAAFLAHWWRSDQTPRDLDAAVSAGAALGAAATAWQRPLPDEAYARPSR